uniref:CUE domain-containing protein n=1 Tax=Octopus bimaculoides TaxID=37653 RepID=A0A0L8FZX6_OCTBM
MASADTQKLNNRRRRDHPRRETLPGGTVSRTHTRQLDFYQAMSDFKHMFPSMEEDVIEAILRANDGAVDATIDQLLTMSVDTDDISCVRKHTPLSKQKQFIEKIEGSLCGNGNSFLASDRDV